MCEVNSSFFDRWIDFCWCFHTKKSNFTCLSSLFWLLYITRLVLRRFQLSQRKNTILPTIVAQPAPKRRRRRRKDSNRISNTNTTNNCLLRVRAAKRKIWLFKPILKFHRSKVVRVEYWWMGWLAALLLSVPFFAHYVIGYARTETSTHSPANHQIKYTTRII